MNSNSKIIIPIVFCGALAIGVFVGSFFFGQKMYGNGTHSSLTKLNEILHYIERDYVEKVNTDSLIDHNIQDIFQLDFVYIILQNVLGYLDYFHEEFLQKHIFQKEISNDFHLHL